jgi:hypothetical protein
MSNLRRGLGLGWPAAVLASVVLTLSCGGSEPVVGVPDTPAPPLISGVAVIVLEGAVIEDRAVLIHVSAGATTFVAGRTELALHSRTSAGSTLVALFGDLAGGAILEVGVADVTAIPTFTLREVSMPDGELRSSLSGYRLDISEIR